ncbi:MAG TPA: cytochrome c oxidase assembly protein, partial [Caulobacteraceae bacterium]|nr:cytochrome c oxidase assembly protein [Caulobacteraceae bacterium]
MVASFAPGIAAAHTTVDAGLPPWSFEPWVVGPMILALGLFTAGWLRLRRRASQGGRRLDRQALLFFAGIAVLAGAVVSPLHAMGSRSFAAHMAEHELMMLAAAPLLVLSRPLAVMLWAFP